MSYYCGPEEEDWNPEDYDGENDYDDDEDDEDDDDWKDPGDEDIEWDGKYSAPKFGETEDGEPWIDESEDIEDAIDNPPEEEEDNKPLSEDEFWPEL